jgi:hypothetical protein
MASWDSFSPHISIRTISILFNSKQKHITKNATTLIYNSNINNYASRDNTNRN